LIERRHLSDEGIDILSHARRSEQIHVLSIDPILAADVEARLVRDRRLKACRIVRPQSTNVREAVEEIGAMQQETVNSRLLIFDVRRVTLPRLRGTFNAIIGYNRRNINKLCFTICIGDGPVNLFHDGYGLDSFIPLLGSHRVDYHPAVYFYDPFLHYEPNELEVRGIDEQFVIPEDVPRRLRPLFEKGADTGVAKMREYFRAPEKSADIQRERRRMLRRLFQRSFLKQFPERREQMKDLFGRDGLELSTEKLHVYPFYLEHWAVKLVRQARENAKATKAN
jgi:hypothetical protein